MLVEKAFISRFLSIAFSYPSEETLAELKGALPDLERSIGELSLDFPVEKVREAVVGSSRRVVDLQGEFTSLFETSMKAPARETSYELDKAGRRSAEMADLLGFYRAFGLEIRAPYEPDSLVAELEFLSFLYQKEHFLKGDGLRVVREAREKFLRDHLGRWYGVFVEKVKEASEEPFYPVMADLLKAFLDRETEGMNIQKLTDYRRETLEGSSWKCGFME
ncbi:MAG: molecular chaperone TorD family protein [Aquificota bacterium]|nr:molecular chaperone TorD family protein [Aquificota bacterium]MDQ7083364.1 molecular chaperone TorD family protein [Aquificota bacterium]